MPECMFCNSSPCTCNKPAARPAKRRIETVPVPILGSPALLTGSGDPLALNQAFGHVPSRVGLAVETLEEAETAATIRAVYQVFGLVDEDARTWAHVLNREPTLQERVVSWRRSMLYWRHRHAR